MHADPRFFYDLAYVFIAAVAGGMLAWRLRQPLILGYVLAGILLSPFTPGPSVTNVATLELFAEIGVILLMFSVGLEFSVRDLWRVRWVALLGAPIGIALSVLLGLGAGQLLGWTVVEGVVIGTVISVASTMVLTRLLIDRGELQTEHARVMVAITLVEDIAVVVLTVLMPHLGRLEPGRLVVLATDLGRAVLILAPVLFIAAKVVPRVLTRAARTHNQELFFGVVLAICLGTAALSQALGLSLALGAFLAGIIISESDYVHEALAQLFPLRDAFVALFFVTIGLLVDPRALFSDLRLLGVMLLLILLGKCMIWTAVVRMFGYPAATALQVGIGLTQIGEFSFILVQVARNSELVGGNVYNATLAASLITILLNAALVRLAPRLVARFQRGEGTRAAMPPGARPEVQPEVVLCGFGRVGSGIGTAFDAFSVRYLVIEAEPDVIRGLASRGIPCLYGDAARPQILERAGVAQARLLVVALPDPVRAERVVRAARALQPGLAVLARAHTRIAYEALLEAGAAEIIQPEIEASTTMIRRALDHLQVRKNDAAAYLDGLQQALARPGAGGSRTAWSALRIADFSVAGTPLIGRSLSDSQVREKFGVTVVAVCRNDGQIVLNPPSETVFEKGDVVRIFGMQEQVERFIAGTAATEVGP